MQICWQLVYAVMDHCTLTLDQGIDNTQVILHILGEKTLEASCVAKTMDELLKKY